MSPYFEQKKGVKFIFRAVPFETIKTMRMLVDYSNHSLYSGIGCRVSITGWERLGWIGHGTVTWKCQGMFYFNMVFYRRGINFDNLKWELWHE